MGRRSNRTFHGFLEGRDKFSEIQVGQRCQHVCFAHGLALALLARVVGSRRDVRDEDLGTLREREQRILGQPTSCEGSSGDTAG